MKEILIVDTTANDPESPSYYHVIPAKREHWEILTKQVEKGQGIRFPSRNGNIVYIPNHAVSAIVYNPGDKQ